MSTTTYQLTKEDDDFILRFPQQLLDEQALSDLLDYLEISAIQRQSQFTSLDAAQLSEKIKKGAWQQVKHLFME